MLRDEFVEKFNAIREEVVTITLDDGAKHIVWAWSVYYEDLLAVEYCEVHAFSTGNRVRVLYSLVVDVAPYSLESASRGLEFFEFMKKMNAICARVTGEDHRTIITLTDGAIHIAPTTTVVYRGFERATYGEVHLKESFGMMIVVYGLIHDVNEYRPTTLVDG